MSFDTSIDPVETFDLLSKLGEGSYGSVFKALDKRNGEIVAVKVLSIDSDETADLLKEIAILKDCNDPHIVRYIGSYQVTSNNQSAIWIVMEYMGVGSLCDLMAICERTLSEEQISCIMKQSLCGLAYLHSNKKIHRDIKSGNLLLNLAGECKLADFGVSAELTNTISKRKTVIGTPYWMAPEVLQSQEYNGKADIWSLAITAYELAVGEPPHSNVHPMRAIFMIPNSEPPTLPPKSTIQSNNQSINQSSEWSRDFQDFIAVCCQKNPDRRPSALDLLRSHPFILKSSNQSIIAQLIDECMPEIDEYRLIEAAELEQESLSTNSTMVANQTGTMIPSKQGTMINQSFNQSNNQSNYDYDDEDVGDTGTMVSYPTGKKPQWIGTMINQSTNQSNEQEEPSYMKHMRQQSNNQSINQSNPSNPSTNQSINQSKPVSQSISQSTVSSAPVSEAQRKINNALNTSTIIQPLRNLSFSDSGNQSINQSINQQFRFSDLYRLQSRVDQSINQSINQSDLQPALTALQQAQQREREQLDKYYETQKLTLQRTMRN